MSGRKLRSGVKWQWGFLEKGHKTNELNL